MKRRRNLDAVRMARTLTQICVGGLKKPHPHGRAAVLEVAAELIECANEMIRLEADRFRAEQAKLRQHKR